MDINNLRVCSVDEHAFMLTTIRVVTGNNPEASYEPG